MMSGQKKGASAMTAAIMMARIMGSSPKSIMAREGWTQCPGLSSIGRALVGSFVQ